MDVSPIALARVLIPQIPNVLKVTFLALFHLSSTSPIQDVATQILVAIVRPILGTPSCLANSQRQTSTDLPIIGPIWVSKTTIPKPEDGEVELLRSTGSGSSNVWGIREALVEAIRVLGNGEETFKMPKVVDVEAEWNAYRSKASWWARRPKCSEKEQYERMMKDVGNDGPTMLYLHGGAFCLMDPSTHRIYTTRLAYLTSGRCFSVRFRMAPQAPFPTSLLDCLVAYLALMAPPPGSYHNPVPASRIVLAGDSSGASLATSLLLLLVTFKHKLGITHLRFHNQDIPIDLPAGLASLHPYLDIARSLPSIHRNAAYDVITPPGSWPSPLFPADEIWPSTPPRVETYCDARTVIHPLVSPVAATTESWKGCPPVYVALGYEGLEDEISVWARRVYQGSPTNVVLFDGYVGMPHCFQFLTPWTKGSRRCFDNWAGFCKDVITSPPTEATSPGSKDNTQLLQQQTSASSVVQRRDYGTWITRKGSIRKVALDDLAMEEDVSREKIRCDDQTVQRLLEEQRDWRVRLEEGLLREWMEKNKKKGGKL